MCNIQKTALVILVKFRLDQYINIGDNINLRDNIFLYFPHIRSIFFIV